jgi:hypothetical protein
MDLSRIAIVAASLALGASLVAAQGTAPKPGGPKLMTANGIVTSVSIGSLAIEGDAKKSLTFVVDKTTRVLARGAVVKLRPTILAPSLKITDLVHRGDRVAVKFFIIGTSTLHAREVQVVQKAGS